MKKLILALIAFPCMAHAGTITTAFSPLGSVVFSTGIVPAFTPFSLSTNTYAFSGDGNTVTSPAINTTGSKLIVVGISHYAAGSPLVLTDSKSNVWTKLIVSSGSIGAASTVLYYSTNPIVGSGHTFTETGTTTFPTITVAAFTGGLSPNVFDQQNGQSHDGPGGSTIQTGTVTPTVDNELLVTIVSADQAGSFSVNSGFTITNQTPYASGSYYGSALAYLINSGGSGVGINPTWTNLSGGSNVMTTRIATFK